MRWLKSLQSKLGPGDWPPEWQTELSAALELAQRSLNLNMIVVIARESGLYAELLFMLCFVGLSLGTVAGYFSYSYLSQPIDLLLFPLAGFCLGATLFQFRRYFVNRAAPKAVEQRMRHRAASVYYEHSRRSESSLILLYVSELEGRMLLLSPEAIRKKVGDEDLNRIIFGLERSYDYRAPLLSLKSALADLSYCLGKKLGIATSPRPVVRPIFLGPTDMKGPVRILKGNSDVN